MRGVTIFMVNEYKLKELGCDFMGYKIDKEASKKLQFHHLVIPRRECQNVPNQGYFPANGAVLIDTSHSYLHKIEHYRRDLFEKITNEMVEENVGGELTLENLLAIRAYLEEFEDEFQGCKSKKGNNIIHSSYKVKRLSKDDLYKTFGKTIDNSVDT